MRVHVHQQIVLLSKLVALACILLLNASCTTQYTGPETATYSIDVTITSDPPGADIYTIPGRSHSNDGLVRHDYAYEKYGEGEHWIGTTPYRTTLNCTLTQGSGGTVGTLWRTDGNLGGGDAIMLVKITQVRQDHVVYVDYHHEFDLSYNLKLDGYANEAATITVAEGTYTYTDMIREASARPVVNHHVLKRR